MGEGDETIVCPTSARCQRKGESIDMKSGDERRQCKETYDMDWYNWKHTCELSCEIK